MAELHVQRKRSNYTWLWAIVLILAILGGLYYYLHKNNPKDYPLPAKPTGDVRPMGMNDEGLLAGGSMADSRWPMSNRVY